MEPSQIGKLLTEKFGSAIVDVKLDVRDPWAMVDAAKIVEICTYLRDSPETKFDFLRSHSGVDYPKENQIELVYFLFSYEHRHAFKVKVRVPRENPRVSTLETVWPAANWYERETYDLFGVEFDGHSDLRRLLLPDDWTGFPLRKDYREMEDYNGVSTSREYLAGMPELPTRPPLPMAGGK